MNRALWTDRDLVAVVIAGVGLGFIIGLAFGYEWARRPIQTCFRYLAG